MHEFRYRNGAFNAVRRKQLMIRIPMLLIAIGIGIGSGLSEVSGTNSLVNSLPILLPVMLLMLMIFTAGIYITLQREKNRMEGFLLNIDEKDIAQIQNGQIQFMIHRDAVSKITRNKDGSFLITGASKWECIAVPTRLEKPELLEQLLNEIHPITEQKNESGIKIIAQAGGLLLFGAMFAIARVENPVVIVISALAIACFVVYLIWTLSRHKNLHPRAKPFLWFIVLLLGGFLMLAYYKLTGQEPWWAFSANN